MRKQIALARDLAAARAEIEAVNARLAAAAVAQTEAASSSSKALTEEKRRLEEERNETHGLARDLAAARGEIEAVSARLAAATVAQTEAVQQQHLRSRSLRSVTRSVLRQPAPRSTLSRRP